MQINQTDQTDIQTTINIELNEAELKPVKDRVLNELGKDLNITGFRPGSAPAGLIERNIDQAKLQTAVVEEAINAFYPKAVHQENIKPVGKPSIQIAKFVPFSSLAFNAQVSVIGKIQIADYKKIKLAKDKVAVTQEDVKTVLDNIRLRFAQKKDVQRAAKENDQVWIDFNGTDTKQQPIKGAHGQDYPLVLGSNTFIPGFEEKIAGLKAGDQKTFDLTFPKDYRVKTLASRKITFDVTVKKVQEVVKPKLDDDLAKQAGPFKSLAELKADIKKQVLKEKQHQANLKYESDLVKKITESSTVKIPDSLVDQQAEHQINQLKNDLAAKGQTIKEFLEVEGLDETQYKDQIAKPEAKNRLKASVILSEISEREGITVKPEELDIRIDVLKEQYKQDQRMQEELSKPENRRDIEARLMTEKTIKKLVDYAAK